MTFLNRIGKKTSIPIPRFNYIEKESSIIISYHLTKMHLIPDAKKTAFCYL